MVRKKDLNERFAEKLTAELGRRPTTTEVTVAISDYYRQLQVKSRQNYKGTGGFAANRKKAKEAGLKGLRSRWGKSDEKLQ